MPKISDSYKFNNLISDIRHGKLLNSYDIALKTEELLEKLITEGHWNTAQELMNLIKTQVKTFITELPLEATSTNIMRHILKIVREEYDSGFKSKIEGQSLHHLVTSDSDNAGDYSKSLSILKSLLMDHLTEYKVELETSADNIAAQATEHIHSNEIILTFGKSNTLEKFLKSAAIDRTFQVIVVESTPSNTIGHNLAANLAKSNIQTTIISDSAVFAIMSRVNKVIIGVNSVMADGGLRASSGVHAIALAAKHYSVPVIVLAHMYKLSPVYVCSHEQEAFNVCASPAQILPYSSGAILNKVKVHNPLFDYVPPELVTLFISHQGGNAPSYIYRLLSELYHPDDSDL